MQLSIAHLSAHFNILKKKRLAQTGTERIYGLLTTHGTKLSFSCEKIKDVHPYRVRTGPYFSYSVFFRGFWITERTQLAWQCDVLWWELRLTGLPSLPTAQPFIKSMPPLNTTLPCGAGPSYRLLPPPVWGGKHRQTDELETPQMPSSCLLFWSGNSTVRETQKQSNSESKLGVIIFSFTKRILRHWLSTADIQRFPYPDIKSTVEPWRNP